jgi:hypothetical protein
MWHSKKTGNRSKEEEMTRSLLIKKTVKDYIAKLDERMVKGHGAKVGEETSEQGKEEGMSEEIPDIGDPNPDQYLIASGYLDSDEESDADLEERTSEEENEEGTSQEVPHIANRGVRWGHQSLKLKMKAS